MTDKTRLDDIEFLLRVIENPMTSSGQRREAEESLKSITNESGLTRSMRERLLKERRAGHTGNVREITEYVHKKNNLLKYGNRE
jgi:hypothetical protein